MDNTVQMHKCATDFLCCASVQVCGPNGPAPRPSRRVLAPRKPWRPIIIKHKHLRQRVYCPWPPGAPTPSVPVSRMMSQAPSSLPPLASLTVGASGDVSAPVSQLLVGEDGDQDGNENGTSAWQGDDPTENLLMPTKSGYRCVRLPSQWAPSAGFSC